MALNKHSSGSPSSARPSSAASSESPSDKPGAAGRAGDEREDPLAPSAPPRPASPGSSAAARPPALPWGICAGGDGGAGRGGWPDGPSAHSDRVNFGLGSMSARGGSLQLSRA